MANEEDRYRTENGGHLRAAYWPPEGGEVIGQIELSGEDGHFWVDTDEAVDLRDMLNELILHANKVENNEGAGN